MVARYLHVDPYLYHYRNYGGRECEAAAPARVRRWRRVVCWVWCIGFLGAYFARLWAIAYTSWMEPLWLARAVHIGTYVLPGAFIVLLLQMEVRVLRRKREWLARGEMYCAKCEYRLDMLPEDSKFCPECEFPRSASERCWSRYQWPLWPEFLYRPDRDSPAPAVGSPIISDGAKETFWVGRRRTRHDPGIPAGARNWRLPFAWFVVCTFPLWSLFPWLLARGGAWSGLAGLGGFFGVLVVAFGIVARVEARLIARKRTWLLRGEAYCAECGSRLDPLEESAESCPACGYSRSASEISWREYRFPFCAIISPPNPVDTDAPFPVRLWRRLASRVGNIWPGSDPTTPTRVWGWRRGCATVVMTSVPVWWLCVFVLRRWAPGGTFTVLVYLLWLGLLIALIQAEVRLLARKRRWMARGEMYCCECGYRIDPLPPDSENCPECGFSRSLSQRSWNHYRYPLFSAWQSPKRHSGISEVKPDLASRD